MVVKDLHTVGPVIAYEDLHLIVHDDAIGEFQISRAAELVQDVAHHVEDNDPHDLAFDDNNPAPAVSGDSPWVLKDVGAKLPDEVAELGKDLNLKSDDKHNKPS